jgi:hypothetical protein
MKPLLLGSSSSTCAFCSLKRSLALEKTLQIARTSSKGLLCLFSAVTQRFLLLAKNLAKKSQIKN